jgi:hypothetical protein
LDYKGKGLQKWQVVIPAYLNDGKRWARRFRTKSEAEAFAEELILDPSRTIAELKCPIVDNVPTLFAPGDHRRTVNVKELSILMSVAGPTLRDWTRRDLIPGAFQLRPHGKWLYRREPLEGWYQELLSRHML